MGAIVPERHEKPSDTGICAEFALYLKGLVLGDYTGLGQVLFSNAQGEQHAQDSGGGGRFGVVA